jgi:hypothetical protein
MVPIGSALSVTQIVLVSTEPIEVSATVTESPGKAGVGVMLKSAVGWIGPEQAVKSICWVTL